MHLVLLGPPGAGKGTQARLVQEHLGAVHISTGDLLRAAIRRETEAGRAARPYMERGELVPDQLVIEMIEGRISKPDCATGFLLDGFPRTLVQGEVLDRMLVRRCLNLDHVVDLQVPRDELTRRLTGRRTCAKCGRMYHVEWNPPAVDGRCEECGGKLFQRDDDRAEVILSRLNVYERETHPLRSYYAERGLLREIDGTGSAEDICSAILERLDGGTA